MKLKLVCYLKSGAVVSDEVEFTDDATIEDVEDTRVSVKNFVNNAIKNEERGTFTIGFTHVNIQELSAYSLTIEGGEYK